MIKIGIIGFGVVGSGVYEVIRTNSAEINANANEQKAGNTPGNKLSVQNRYRIPEQIQIVIVNKRILRIQNREQIAIF